MYGVDVGDRDLLRARTWPWLRTRIEGLLMVEDSRLSRFFVAQQQREEVDSGTQHR